MTKDPDTTSPNVWRPTHRHWQRGTEYRVIGIGAVQSAAALNDMAAVVIYEDAGGLLWARERAEFFDGRFQPLSSGEPSPEAEAEPSAELVELVAHAIASEDGGPGNPLGYFPSGAPMRISTWEEFMPIQHEAWRAMARAALAALGNAPRGALAGRDPLGAPDGAAAPSATSDGSGA